METSSSFNMNLNYLQSRYDFFNHMLFDDKLPNIPIAIKTLKNAGGKVVGKLVLSDRPPPNRIMVRLGREDKLSNYDIADMKMYMSNKYQRNTEELDKVLVHEMIHVYFWSVNIRPNESHGYLFQQEVARCSKIVGFQIPMKDDIDDKVFNDDVIKLKTIGVIVMTKKDGTQSLALVGKDYMTPETMEDAYKNNPSFGYIVYHRYPLDCFLIADKIWSEIAMQLPIQRLSRNMKWYTFKDERYKAAIDDLRKNGRLVKQLGGS